MPNESTVHFIVMYTITEKHKTNLREIFRTNLINEFHLDNEKDRLNESAYQVHENDRITIISRIQKIIDILQSEESLSEEDFIDLYCSGIRAGYNKKIDPEAYQNIIRIKIFPHQ